MSHSKISLWTWPLLTKVGKDGIAADLTFRDTTLSVAVRTIKRFEDYINLIFVVDIDERQASIEFLPVDKAELEQLAVLKFDLAGQKRKPDDRRIFVMLFSWILGIYPPGSEGRVGLPINLATLRMASIGNHIETQAFDHIPELLPPRGWGRHTAYSD